MDDDYRDVQIPSENHDMDGQIMLDNCYMENDYMTTDIRLGHHYTEVQII